MKNKFKGKDDRQLWRLKAIDFPPLKIYNSFQSLHTEDEHTDELISDTQAGMWKRKVLLGKIEIVRYR